jgi:hypothetical protein
MAGKGLDDLIVGGDADGFRRGLELLLLSQSLLFLITGLYNCTHTIHTFVLIDDSGDLFETVHTYMYSLHQTCCSL